MPPICAPFGVPAPSPSSPCAARCTGRATGSGRTTGSIWPAAKRVRPDIAFTARRVAVFVDGCFWHACPEHGGKPNNNVWYWEPKLRRNVERDRAADAALLAAGWDVVRVWEHETIDAAVLAVLTALEKSRPATNGWLARPRVRLRGSDARLPAVHVVGAGRLARRARGRLGPGARLRGHARAARVVLERRRGRARVRRDDAGGPGLAPAAAGRPGRAARAGWCWRRSCPTTW